MASTPRVLSDEDYLTAVTVPPKDFLGIRLTYNEMRSTMKSLVQRHHAAGTVESYGNFRKFMKALCTTYLPISVTPSSQPDCVVMILKEIHIKYPSLFGKDRNNAIKRLILARNLVCEVHGGLRRAYNHKLTRRSDPKNRTLNKKSLRPSGLSSVKKHDAITSSRKASPNRSRSPTPLSSDEGTITYRPSYLVVKPAQKSHDLASTSRCAPAKTATQKRDEAYLSPPGIQALRDVNNNTEGAKSISKSVEQFLSTCWPPLDHLSIHFSKYGCTTEAHLFRLATWEKNIRYERLRDMLKGVKEMDILLLEEHLDTYVGSVGK